jgi:hypothetical protein
MPDDAERERETQQTERPQDGPAAGGSSQDEPGAGEGSEETGGNEAPRPSSPPDTNERADARATVVEPDGEPAPEPAEED